MNFRMCASILAVTLPMIACQTSGVDRAQETVSSMRALYKSVEAAPAKIDAVTASLTELAKGQGDMRAQFTTFGKNIESLESQRAQIRSLRQSVQANKETFVLEWDKQLMQIQDDDLRELSKKRQRETVAEFEKITESADKTSKMFEPWMQKVEDLHAYLETDLNPGGVASISGQAKEISAEAGKINESIKGVLAQVDALAKQIEATKPPPPAPKTTQS